MLVLMPHNEGLALVLMAHHDMPPTAASPSRSKAAHCVLQPRPQVTVQRSWWLAQPPHQCSPATIIAALLHASMVHPSPGAADPLIRPPSPASESPQGHHPTLLALTMARRHKR
jgi:hypothetical protein